MENLDRSSVNKEQGFERIFINELKNLERQKVLLRGWVHKITYLSQVVFIRLRDKSGIIQLVCEKEQVKNLRLENAIEVVGKVCSNEKGT